MMYRHTQSGRLMILSALGMLAAGVAGAMATGKYPPFYLLSAVAAFIYFGFRDLTVEVDHEAVRISFGVGWFRKKFPLSDIESSSPVRNSWLHGWGMHYVGNGWLYNVDGYDAVELRFRNGKIARIGTDEPGLLDAAVKERLATGKGR